ncbi:MAG: DUF1499 domain-containing protein [Pseudomonadota bacterium]
MTVMILLAALAILVGYIRLAPSDPAVWNRMPAFTADKDMANGVERVVQTGPDGLRHLADVARQTPRTTVLAGTPDDGMMTFVTRSQIWGFPDYTTAQQDGDTLKIYARQRFGSRDLGVNKARVDGWIARL